MWKSQLIQPICLATAEAEYYSLSHCLRTLIPIRRTLEELTRNLRVPAPLQATITSTVFEDNRAAKILATTEPPRLTPRSKHLAVRYHWFSSHIGVKDGKGIIIEDVQSSLNKADFFTKALARDPFCKNRLAVCGW